MANKEHLALLKQGIDVWNRWRREHPDIQPDLSGADLHGASLRELDLHEADLHDANLAWVDLRKAHLFKARLMRTNLYESILSGAILFEADLSGANLNRAVLSGAVLSRAILRRADLMWANLSEANLHEADLNNAKMAKTVLNNLDLRRVKSLETVEHFGPSDIGIQTIYKSHGEIPEVFLRGAGVPEQFIEYTRSLVGKPIKYYSCFISHSSKDHAFAERLHADLQSKGVRCWFAPEDLPIGEKIRPGIDQAIRKHEKLLLVLSEHSVASDWVEQEVETAFERERQEQKLVLFPVRLDEAVMQIKDGWPAHLRRTRNIGNFTSWKDNDAYQQAFERLLRDLTAESN